MGEVKGPVITVYDYGVGNIHSISKALELAGARIEVATEVSEVLEADALVFPGVGDFGTVMRNIGPRARELTWKLLSGTPTLGICIGFQIMFESSEEARNKGLGFMNGRVERFRGVRLPHMGWNEVVLTKSATSDPLLKGIPQRTHFYFANSYSPRVRGGRRLGRTEYGRAFPSIMRRGNAYGTQFHPEKSGRHGLKLIDNFVRFVEGSLRR
jgi:glutamine amidotransferase